MEFVRRKIELVYRVCKKIINKIKSFFAPWSFFGSYIYFPIKMKLRKMGIGSRYYKQIELIKDKHAGERCFIIATGPSLTLEDVNMIKDEYTIGENSLFKWYDKMGWIPTYYAMTDPNLTSRIINNNENINFDGFAKEKCIFSSLNKKQVKCNKAIFVDINWLDHVYNYGKSTRFKFNPDLKYGIYDYYSITQECIIYAIYMGFKEIYIIGADNNYFGEKQHFAECHGETDLDYTMAKLTQDANDMGYTYVKTIAEKYGVKIFNATRGGKVKCFDRVNLEEVIANK